jgi:hypothetical protein
MNTERNFILERNQFNGRFEHLTEPSVRELCVGIVEKRIGRPTHSPIFAEMKDMVSDPLALKEAREILSTLLNLRNQSELTKTPVFLEAMRVVTLPDSQIDNTSTETFLEIEFTIPEGVRINQDLLRQLTEFYAREVWREERGTFDESPREKDELPKYTFGRFWDYDPLDKLSNKLIARMREEIIDMDGTKGEIVEEGGFIDFLEPARKKRRKDPSTGTVVFTGKKDVLELSYDFKRALGKTHLYTDDVSASMGILLFDSRPTKIDDKFIEEFFRQLPFELEGCGVSEKAILRLRPGNYRLDIREIDLYFITTLLADILAGRVEYKVNGDDIGSVGHHYRKEVNAIMAVLNSSRYRNLSFETLPGVETLVNIIHEQLIEPLAQGKLDEAQDIMLVGAPGTGKTAITTAFSRIDNGVALVSVNAKKFLSGGKRILNELASFHDRYGIHSVVILQDAEALFTNALFMGSEGAGAPVDPEKRQFVLELLNGERPTRVKFLLTVNKPGYIDEALRRRFLLLYAGLPGEDDRKLYTRMADASLARLLSDGDSDRLRSELAPIIAEESLGYPQAFVAKLSEMVLPHLRKLKGNPKKDGKLKKIVKTNSQRLKDGYPIKEIKELDQLARKVAAQTRI